ncbi:MAG: hypothetical protein ACRC92_26925 [Peptostreptococcaceae bacterium]
MKLEDEIERMSMSTMAIFIDDFEKIKESFKTYLSEIDSKATLCNLCLIRSDNGVKVYDNNNGRDIVSKVNVTNFFAKKIRPNSSIGSIKDANYGNDFFYFTNDTLLVVLYDKSNQLYDVTISSKYDTDIFLESMKKHLGGR